MGEGWHSIFYLNAILNQTAAILHNWFYFTWRTIAWEGYFISWNIFSITENPWRKHSYKSNKMWPVCLSS